MNLFTIALNVVIAWLEGRDPDAERMLQETFPTFDAAPIICDPRALKARILQSAEDKTIREAYDMLHKLVLAGLALPVDTITEDPKVEYIRGMNAYEALVLEKFKGLKSQLPRPRENDPDHDAI